MTMSRNQTNLTNRKSNIIPYARYSLVLGEYVIVLCFCCPLILEIHQKVEKEKLGVAFQK